MLADHIPLESVSSQGDVGGNDVSERQNVVGRAASTESAGNRDGIRLSRAIFDPDDSSFVSGSRSSQRSRINSAGAIQDEDVSKADVDGVGCSGIFSDGPFLERLAGRRSSYGWRRERLVRQRLSIRRQNEVVGVFVNSRCGKSIHSVSFRLSWVDGLAGDGDGIDCLGVSTRIPVCSITD